VDDRQLLEQCFSNSPEYDFCSLISSDEDFISMPQTPTSDVEGQGAEDAIIRRIHFAMSCNSDGEDTESADGKDDGQSIEEMFSFAGLSGLVGDSGAGSADLKGWSIAESDDDSEADDQELEELFGFDPETVAEALRRGASLLELSDVIEEAMAGILETRLAASTATLVAKQCRASSPHEATASGECAPRVTGDLEGLMTPTRSEGCDGDQTPPVASAPTVPGLEFLGMCVQERLASVSGSKRRRSSLASHPQLADAVSAQSARHRRSLFAAVTAGGAVEGMLTPAALSNVRRSLAGAHRLRRQSLLKAAEVLEVAGVGVEAGSTGTSVVGAAAAASSPQAIVSQQLRLVQRAVERARQRHRQSIARAVGLAAQRAEADAGAGRALPCQGVAEERVQRAIAAAYARHRARGRRAGAAPALAALMHARVLKGPRPHFVHCGPGEWQEPPRRRRAGGRCA